MTTTQDYGAGIPVLCLESDEFPCILNVIQNTKKKLDNICDLFDLL